MYVHKYQFLFVMFVAALAGCTDITIIVDRPTTPVPADAGLVSVDDAGFAPDGGPVGEDSGPTTVDSGSADADRPVVPLYALSITFEGPADSLALRGSQDANMFMFSITAHQDIEILRVPDELAGLTSADRVIGSAGTEYFRDRKLKDIDTNETVMGPSSLGDGPLEGSVVMETGETRRFMVTMDVANSEDAPNELFGDGNNRYRVTVGDEAGRFFPPDGVRRLADGSFVEPEAIERNVRIVGNSLTIVDVSLSVTMAPSPFSTIGVSHEPYIPAVGVTFTASTAADAYLRAVRFSGRGDVAGFFDTMQLDDVITSCTFFNAAGMQVGRSRSPESTTGELLIDDINLTVDAATSLTLYLRCNADTVVLQDTGDRFALGIDRAEDVVAERPDGYAITAAIGGSLIDNASAFPTNIVTVMRHAAVTIEAGRMRESAILIADPSVWQNMGELRVQTRYEPVDLLAMRMASQGEAASFTEVAFVLDGSLLGTGILPSGTNSERDIMLTSPPRIERDSARYIQVWARLASVLSRASVGGATSGVPLSGNQIRLGLAAGVETGEWDSGYAGRLNARFRGVVSGDRPLASGTQILGNEFVVRKTKLTLTRQPLRSATLEDGSDQDLYSVQATANAAGSGSMRRIAMVVEVHSATGQICNIGLRRGAEELRFEMSSTDDYQIRGPGGFISPSQCWDSSWGPLIIYFLRGERVTGIGNTYTLHGTPSGFVAGDLVIIRFETGGDTEVVTGYLYNEGGYDILIDSSPWGTFGAGPFTAGGFTWSDESETPSSAAVGALGGSYDWTNGRYVVGLSYVEVLTR